MRHLSLLFPLACCVFGAALALLSPPSHADTLPATSLSPLSPAPPEELPPDDVDPDNYHSITSPIARKNDRDKSKFVTCMTADSAGQIWIGTEGNGLWRYSPTGPRKGAVKGFSTPDGLGDNKIYALAIDHQNRVWAGHLNHGVSVFSGESWRNYPLTSGPAGSRVYAIAVAPNSGDVFIASSGGLTRYSESSHTWSTLSAPNFANNQIRALAFDSKSTLFIGTAHNGLAIASPTDDYHAFTLRTMADALPSNLINALLVARNDTLYVATHAGLAVSSDHGAHFSATTLVSNIASLAEEPDGHIWIGTQHDLQVLEPERHRIIPVDSQYLRFEDHIVSALAVSRTGSLLVGQYGGGVTASPVTADPTPITPIDDTTIPQLPPSAAAPSADELKTLLADLSKVPAIDPAAPTLVQLPSDWDTQGAWLGRYGRFWACLAAFISPDDFTWGPAAAPVNYYIQLGPNHDPADDVRAWVGVDHLKDWRALELPLPYLQNRITKNYTTWDVTRRHAGWDDHGEVHPLTESGPDLVLTLQVPPGDFRLALYFVNFDAQDAAIYQNARRDMLLSIHKQPDSSPIADITGLDAWPILAQTRIDNFYGGMYARYWVHGPQTIAIHIAKNRSYNTMLNAVFLDPTEEYPAPYYDATTRNAAALAKNTLVTSPQIENLADLTFANLQSLQLTNPSWHAQNAYPYYETLARAYENALAQKNSSDSRTESLTFRLATCYFNLGLYYRWEQQQRTLGILTSRDIERGLRWDGQPGPSPGECKRLVTAFRLDHTDALKTTQ